MTIGIGRVAPELARDVEAIEPGRPRSSTTRSGCRCANAASAPRSVAGGQDGEPGVLEVIAGELDDLRLIVDDEDGLHVARIVERQVRPRTAGSEARGRPRPSSGGANGPCGGAGVRVVMSVGAGCPGCVALPFHGPGGASRRKCIARPASVRQPSPQPGPQPPRRPGPPRKKIARTRPNTMKRKKIVAKKPKIQPNGCQKPTHSRRPARRPAWRPFRLRPVWPW